MKGYNKIKDYLKKDNSIYEKNSDMDNTLNKIEKEFISDCEDFYLKQIDVFAPSYIKIVFNNSFRIPSELLKKQSKNIIKIYKYNKDKLTKRLLELYVLFFDSVKCMMKLSVVKIEFNVDFNLKRFMKFLNLEILNEENGNNCIVTAGGFRRDFKLLYDDDKRKSFIDDLNYQYKYCKKHSIFKNKEV